MSFWLQLFSEETETESEQGDILLKNAKLALHETFENWHWCDHDITEEEIDLEYQMGEGPKGRCLPMGCDNPTMQPYCIGKENCPYSIYKSLPSTQEM
jgi:hypothetical protein